MSKSVQRPRPTIVDVAREAGVSTATVSNALNSRRYVDARTKVRVAEAVARLGYTPNVHARRLRSTGIGTIGLFSSMPFAVSGRASRLGFLMEIAAAAAVKALERGYALLLIPPPGAGMPPVSDLAIDAAVIVEPSDDDAYVTQLRERGLPLVTIGRSSHRPEQAPYVDLHLRETTSIILEHLWSAGSRRTALITGSSSRAAYTEAQRSYSRFVRKTDQVPIVELVDEQGGEEAAYVSTMELLRSYPDIDGVYASVDTFAAGASRAIADLGRKIPSDVRIATRYDGFRARTNRPPLTAVDLHLGDAASASIELVIALMESGGRSETYRRAPRPTLVVRGSTVADDPSSR
jgi:DNA-binding LacI/PurR family transcriptional regulator